jgi:hypothetical protein
LEKRYVPTPTHDELEAMREGDSWLESPRKCISRLHSAFDSLCLSLTRCPALTLYLAVTDTGSPSS